MTSIGVLAHLEAVDDLRERLAVAFEIEFQQGIALAEMDFHGILNLTSKEISSSDQQ